MGDELLDDLDLLDDLENISMNYAPLDKRFKAFGIDFIIIAIMHGFIARLLLDLEEGGLGYAIVLVFLFVVYFSFQESSTYKASLGKRYYGLKVCGLGEERIGLMRAVLRQFGKILSYLLSIIGLFVLVRSKHKQGIHDFMVRTVVLDAYYESDESLGIILLDIFFIILCVDCKSTPTVIVTFVTRVGFGGFTIHLRIFFKMSSSIVRNNK